MNDAIEINKLGKRYTIKTGEQSVYNYVTLRDSIANAVKNLFSGKKDDTVRHNRDFWALRDITLKIKQGERIGIIGRNGAGKSTLLKNLSRVTTPTEGHIKIRGRVSSLLEVGTGFHPELTGRENVFLNASIMGMSRREIKEKFNEIIKFAEIEKFLDVPVKRYSSGMYVRLGFAVAAHLDPDILIVDEVLAVGDVNFQKKCINKMKDITNSKKTLLFVSHNLNAILNLCNRCILIDEGRLIKDGSTKEVVDHYLSLGLNKMDGDVDLTPDHMRKNSKTESLIKWKRFRILNRQGQVMSALTLNEPFKLELTADITEDCKDSVLLSLGIDSEAGFPAFNTFKEYSDIKKGEAVFELEFDSNYFAPGHYSINFGIHGDNVLDWIPNATTVRIDAIDRTGKMLLHPNFSGVIVHPCKWIVKQLG